MCDSLFCRSKEDKLLDSFIINGEYNKKQFKFVYFPGPYIVDLCSDCSTSFGECYECKTKMFDKWIKDKNKNNICRQCCEVMMSSIDIKETTEELALLIADYNSFYEEVIRSEYTDQDEEKLNDKLRIVSVKMIELQKKRKSN